MLHGWAVGLRARGRLLRGAEAGVPLAALSSEGLSEHLPSVCTTLSRGDSFSLMRNLKLLQVK